MILKVLKSGNPLLRRKSKPVGKIDKKILSLISNMEETLATQKDPEGVGLAAPQVGKLLRIFISDETQSGVFGVFINPEIVSTSKSTVKQNKKTQTLEGCLSVPHYYGPLVRAKSVVLKFTDKTGKVHKEKFTGFAAQIVQHEVDHLNGILFIDHMLKKKIPLYKQNIEGEWEEVEL